jgi:formate-dependent nitrite reductase membrane component NrfD
LPPATWSKSPSSEGAEPGGAYYDRPVLKEPVWVWAVPAYFYSGGAAGAAAVLAACAQAVDRDGMAGLVSRARWVAAGGSAAGTALLVYDLGRPARFLNMLRVVRVTSPLNLGSWILATTTPLALVSALLARRSGRIGRLGDLCGLGAGVAGLPMSGYTSVLLSSTAVPAWQQARRSLPPLFVASAVSVAAALVEPGLSPREAAVARRFGAAGRLAKLVSTIALEREIASVERVGRPYHHGLSGVLWKASRVLGGASLVATFLPNRVRGRRPVTAVLATLAALSMRFAVFYAGKASAIDPRATFDQQRAGHGAAEVRNGGTPGITG